MSNEAFDHAIKFVLPHEAEYRRGHWGDDAFVLTEHDADDPGGTTRYGIDARSHPGVDIEHLTREQAIEIYRKEWDEHHLDALPERLAIAAFDVWVNGGHANEWLQEAYNEAHTNRPPLKVDGVLGPASLEALRSCDEKLIIKFFLAERDARFRLLGEKPRLQKYKEGWLDRDADLRTFLA
jgi:lysozyme family protein